MNALGGAMAGPNQHAGTSRHPNSNLQGGGVPILHASTDPKWVQHLLDWYQCCRRDLPWRDTDDPYAIWVSEIMLQQTRVDTVLRYYPRFIARFPTTDILAHSPLDAVLHTWQGLGYYARARNLHRAATIVSREHQGHLPADIRALRALPGIGTYTAAAIGSIAYGIPRPAVDANAARVTARLFGRWEDVGKPSTLRTFCEILEQYIPPLHPGDFNQAVMELGALLCLPQNPRCPDCPLVGFCVANRRQWIGVLPRKQRRRAVEIVTRGVVGVHHHGQYLLHRRPERGLLGGLWEFPGGDHGTKAALRSMLTKSLGIHLKDMLCRGSYSHSFTHLRWDITVYHADWVPGPLHPVEAYTWISPAELPNYAMPSAFLPASKLLGIQ